MAKINMNFNITEKAKELLIEQLTEELIILRTKLGLSQEELSGLLGISRQTYSALETRKRPMSWGTYLSLILIFDNNEQTKNIIRETGIFPDMLFGTNVNTGRDNKLSDISELIYDDIIDKLDKQAIHAIETVIMLEYARCTMMSGAALISAFDGRKFIRITEEDVQIS